MLTEPEHRAMDLLAEFTNVVLTEVIDTEGHYVQADRREIVADIHRLQQRIMAQSAARDHPDLYRLMGADFQ